MSVVSRVAVVTGANKGIGYAVVKALLFGSKKFGQFDGNIYLTSRDVGRGSDAVERLKSEPEAKGKIELVDKRIKYHQLDVTKDGSVRQFVDYLQDVVPSGIDVLINNAGRKFGHDTKVAFGEQARETVDLNYYGTKRMTNALLPLMKKSGSRIVNNSSYCGLLFHLHRKSPIRERIASDSLDADELDEIVEEFVTSAADGTFKDKGFCASQLGPCYIMSKIAVCAFTRLVQRHLDSVDPNGRVVLCHLHPGYVSTDMTKHKGPLSIEEGAESSVFAALESASKLDEIRGQMIWKDCTFIDWKKFSAPP